MSKKVLIIDDEIDVVAYLRAVLEDHGFECLVARSAESGLEVIIEQRPDLICLDIMMPGESGISLYLKLCGNKSLCDIPVFFISGMVKEEEFDFRNLVPNRDIPRPRRYIEKPIDVLSFIRMVDKEIGSVRPSNEAITKAKHHE
ncbi:MAG: response regulator [Candidatus Zixiibacteriota bacterium]